MAIFGPKTQRTALYATTIACTSLEGVVSDRARQCDVWYRWRVYFDVYFGRNL